MTALEPVDCLRANKRTQLTALRCRVNSSGAEIEGALLQGIFSADHIICTGSELDLAHWLNPPVNIGLGIRSWSLGFTFWVSGFRVKGVRGW